MIASVHLADVGARVGFDFCRPTASWRQLRETLWALIVEGICVPGIDDSNENWPWISLTEYGDDVAKASGPVPHDPSGYLQQIAAQGPLDEIEESYLGQALEAHNRGLPDASAVVLGAAVEHLLETLVETIGLKDAAEQARAASALAGPAAAAHRYALDYFTARQSGLPRRLRETLPTTFGTVAALIRATRNDAGHPALPHVSRDESFVNLQLFPRLRAWLLESESLLPL